MIRPWGIRKFLTKDLGGGHMIVRYENACI